MFVVVNGILLLTPRYALYQLKTPNEKPMLEEQQTAVINPVNTDISLDFCSWINLRQCTMGTLYGHTRCTPRGTNQDCSNASCRKHGNTTSLSSRAVQTV